LKLVDRVVNYYRDHAKKQRLGEFINEITFEKFKKEVLS
jgi:dissimilatory sulfite reductase (desulfoviridin) alpha/beta subunit